MTTMEIGRRGEKIAARFLKKNGYKILERNKHQSHNEIDIIAANRKFLLFVEVKTRSVGIDLNLKYGSPASAVDRRKQLRTIQAAKDYLARMKGAYGQPRMDVIEVYLDKSTGKVIKINHISNAFGV